MLRSNTKTNKNDEARKQSNEPIRLHRFHASVHAVRSFQFDMRTHKTVDCIAVTNVSAAKWKNSTNGQMQKRRKNQNLEFHFMTFALRNNQKLKHNRRQNTQSQIVCWLQTLKILKCLTYILLICSNRCAVIALVFIGFSCSFLFYFSFLLWCISFFLSHYLCSRVKPLIKYRTSIIFYRMSICRIPYFVCRRIGIFFLDSFEALCSNIECIAIFHLKIITLFRSIFCATNNSADKMIATLFHRFNFIIRLYDTKLKRINLVSIP